MKHVDALLGSSSNQNRRRRRATQQQQPNDHLSNAPRRNDDKKGRGRNNSFPAVYPLWNPCLHSFNAITSCTKKWHPCQRKRSIMHSGDDKREVLLLLSIVSLLILAITGVIKLAASNRFHLFSSSTPLGRPLTDTILNQMPITIPIFDFNGQDLGGWRHPRRFFHPSDTLKISLVPQFGDIEKLKIHREEGNRVLSNQWLAKPRLIDLDDEYYAEEYWKELRSHDPHMSSYEYNKEELEDSSKSCRAPTFAKKYLPSCNGIHEIKLYEDFNKEHAKRPGDDQFYDSFYISHGAFREVWLLHQFSPVEVKSALKVTRYKKDWSVEYFWYTLNDAMVMEQLTGSPRIVNIYGHCAGTVWVEAMPHELEEIIVPGEGMAKQKDLPKIVKPKNDYLVEEKLDIALIMAESLADLHGFKDGVIVHDDVQLCQWLRTKDGTIKLGDFNRAEVMDFNEKKQEYCTYYNGGCGGNYRAPEEYDKQYLNEQIDVYSFGNNIYGLLTGLWVFYDVDDDATVQKEVIKGTRAYIDPQWRERSFIESKLVDLMERCWLEDPEERITIFDAISELKAIKEEHQKRKTKGTEWKVSTKHKRKAKNK